MASKKLITFYVAHVVEPIRKKMNQDALGVGLEADFTNEMVDTLLKHNVEIDKSKIEMSNIELINLCRYGFQFGDGIGLELDFPKGELDELIDLNIK